jgi:hypothetical protein
MMMFMSAWPRMIVEGNGNDALPSPQTDLEPPPGVPCLAMGQELRVDLQDPLRGGYFGHTANKDREAHVLKKNPEE